MKLVYRKSTGEVVMVGCQVENKTLTTIEVPDDERAKTYKMYVEDRVVRYEKHPAALQEEKVKQLKDDLTKAATIKDLKDIIVKLI